MTRIAIYEKTEGRKNEPVARYFRSDYIGLKILGSVICATVVFLMIIGLYVLCNSETLMVDFYRIDLLGEARKLILVDIGFVIDERTRRVIAIGAIDNLVKGAAGQAVQNMNLLFGLDEAEGLRLVPMFP